MRRCNEEATVTIEIAIRARLENLVLKRLGTTLTEDDLDEVRIQAGTYHATVVAPAHMLHAITQAKGIRIEDIAEA
jgi:hypothetical protein